MVTAAAQTPAHLEPVDYGHEHVEDDGIRLNVAVRLEAVQGFVAVGSELDLVSLELERASQGVPHGPFVVYDQDLHGPIVLVEAERELRGRR
jgi:hypothetical protein